MGIVLEKSCLLEHSHDDGWLYPDLDNCQCFWDCANGSPFYRCCGPGTLFDDWVAGGVCVDWVSDNFAWWCEVEWSGPDHWTLTACASLSPVVTCHPGV